MTAYAFKDGSDVLVAGEQGGVDQPRELEYHAGDFGMHSRRRCRSRECGPPGS